MRFSMLSVLRARNECELTFLALTRRARHSAIDSVNKSRLANSFSNRTPKRFLFLPRYTIYEVTGKSRIKFHESEFDGLECEFFYFNDIFVRSFILRHDYIEKANYKYTLTSNVADFSVTLCTGNCTIRMKLREGSTASRNGFLPFRRQHDVTIIAYFCEKPRSFSDEKANLTWARAIR